MGEEGIAPEKPWALAVGAATDPAPTDPDLVVNDSDMGLTCSSYTELLAADLSTIQNKICSDCAYWLLRLVTTGIAAAAIVQHRYLSTDCHLAWTLRTRYLDYRHYMTFSTLFLFQARLRLQSCPPPTPPFPRDS